MTTLRRFTHLEKALGLACLLLSAAVLLIFIAWLREGVATSIIAGKVSMLFELERYAKESGTAIQLARAASRAAAMAPPHAASSSDIILGLVATNTVRNLCSELRHRTGKKYSDDPQEWLEALSGSSSSAPNAK